MDFYCLLGVSHDADLAEVKAAYRSLAKKYHPDRNHNDESCEFKFKKINEAYEVLSDQHKRQMYDRKYHRARVHEPKSKTNKAKQKPPSQPAVIINRSPQWSDWDPTSIPDDVIELPCEYVDRPDSGRDVVTSITMSESELAHGCDKHISIQRRVLCNICFGRPTHDDCERCHGLWNTTTQYSWDAPSVCPQCKNIRSRICYKCRGVGLNDWQTAYFCITIGSNTTRGSKLTLPEGEESPIAGRPPGKLHITIC